MKPEAEVFLTAPRRVFWRVLQGAFFGVGVVILAALFLRPELGLHLLWNVLIPVAPALLVLAPGLWRNVCPMGTASLLPYHAKLSRRIPVSERWQSILLAVAVLLLLVIVPLRHVALDRSGVITGTVLLAVAFLAGGLGFVFDTRSAWCSGLCPVYPVEMLYGAKPLVTVRNARCRTCSKCVAPCRDSKDAMTPQDASRRGPGRWAALLLVGGFPGFIIGWYQVPTWEPAEGIYHLPEAYAWPMGGLVISLVLFLALLTALPRTQAWLTTLFAAAAVGAYYWFKAPVMIGLGDPGAALVDLSAVLPDWTIWPLRAGVVLLFAALLLVPRRPRPWSLQPPKRMVDRAYASV